MSFTPLTIDRNDLTIMGVVFPNLDMLERTALAVTSNMYEGYQLAKRGIEIIRDYCMGILSFEQMAALAREKAYEELL